MYFKSDDTYLSPIEPPDWLLNSLSSRRGWPLYNFFDYLYLQRIFKYISNLADEANCANPEDVEN
jgi:hypothetical protein